MAQARGSGETMTTRATTSAENDGGTACAGASAKAAPCRGGSPTSAASRRLAGRLRSRRSLVARRYAPTGTATGAQATIDSGQAEADHDGCTGAMIHTTLLHLS
jgi:hypothetical protein